MYIYSVCDLKGIYKLMVCMGCVKLFMDCICFIVVDKDEDRFLYYIYVGI